MANGRADIGAYERFTRPYISQFQVSPSTVSEGQSCQAEVSFPGPTASESTLTAHWPDGEQSVHSIDAESTGFQTNHTMNDDEPSETGQDDSFIYVSTSDDQGLVDMSSATIRIENVNPAIGDARLKSSTIYEGDSAFFSGTIVDPGQDSFVLTLDWKDGTSEENHDFSESDARDFEYTHCYAENGDYWISALAIDDDGGQGSDSKLLTVRNKTPRLINLTFPSSVGENAPGYLEGDIEDPGVEDEFTLVVDWGDGTGREYDLGTGRHFRKSHRYSDDDPTGTGADGKTVTATVRDDDGGEGSRSVSTVVTNVAPEFSFRSVPEKVGEQTEATVGFRIEDNSKTDTFTVEIDWGDGSAPERRQYPALGGEDYVEGTLSHVYGDDNPTGTASDSHGQLHPGRQFGWLRRRGHRQLGQLEAVARQFDPVGQPLGKHRRQRIFRARNHADGNDNPLRHKG